MTPEEYVVIPTWIIARLIIPFVKSSHPYYKKKFTLSEWYKRSTQLNIILSLLLWIFFTVTISLAITLSLYES